MAGSNQLPTRAGSWTIHAPSPTTGNCVGHRRAEADRGGHCCVKRIRAALTKSDGGAARKIAACFITHKHRWSLARRSGGATTGACRHREIASAFRAEATCGEITMTCDKYENALLLAAASNDKLDAKLARHLEHCSTCRMTLRSERELFSRIDRTLHAQVNEDPPSAFLAQLRLQLSKEVTARSGSNRVWHVAGAALALILIAALYSLVNARQSSIQGNLETPTIRVAQSARITRSARAREDFAVRSRHHSKHPAVQSAAAREPEVLVPPDEQKALAQFVACVARGDAMAQAVVTPAANKTVNRSTELPQVPSVDIADLQLGRARQEEWINQMSSSE
jgi:hypothetical protein